MPGVPCTPWRICPSSVDWEIERLEQGLPAMADLMASHRSAALGGHQLADLMPLQERRPEQLLALHRAWKDDVGVLTRQSPTLVFAVLGQARAMGLVDPVDESRVLSDVLTAWAVRSSLDVVERAASSTASFRPPPYRRPVLKGSPMPVEIDIEPVTDDKIAVPRPEPRRGRHLPLHRERPGRAPARAAHVRRGRQERQE